MRSAHARDDAEAARVIATLSDFDVSEVTRCETEAGSIEIRDEDRGVG